MTLILEFSPAEERELQTRAEREGLTVEEFARRNLLTPAPTPAEPEWRVRLRESQAVAQQAFLASGLTEEEIGADIDAEVKAYRAERRTVSY
jgi:hypothetical protein